MPEGKAGAVANLSGLELCVLGRNPGKNLIETMQKVVSFTSMRKKNRFSLNFYTQPILLRTLLPFDLFKGMVGKALQIVVGKGAIYPMFTNLGLIEEDRLVFGRSPCQCRVLIPAVYPPFLGGGLSGYKGGLTFTVGIFCKSTERIKSFPCYFDEVIKNEVLSSLANTHSGR